MRDPICLFPLRRFGICISSREETRGSNVINLVPRVAIIFTPVVNKFDAIKDVER